MWPPATSWKMLIYFGADGASQSLLLLPAPVTLYLRISSSHMNMFSSYAGRPEWCVCVCVVLVWYGIDVFGSST